MLIFKWANARKPVVDFEPGDELPPGEGEEDNPFPTQPGGQGVLVQDGDGGTVPVWFGTSDSTLALTPEAAARMMGLGDERSLVDIVPTTEG